MCGTGTACGLQIMWAVVIGSGATCNVVNVVSLWNAKWWDGSSSIIFITLVFYGDTYWASRAGHVKLDVGFVRLWDMASERNSCWIYIPQIQRAEQSVLYWCRIHLWFRYVGGFVRKVDDVTAYLAARPSRLRAHHRNKLSLRVYCCCCRCILHLQQYSRRLNLYFFFLFNMQYVS